MTTLRADPRLLAHRAITDHPILRDVLRVLAANALLILCAKIAVPLPWTPVPITGQTFAVMLVAVWLGSRRGSFALFLYLLEGAAALPVFQPWGAPGAARFFGPTAGYLLSYPVAAFAMGWLAERAGALSIRHLVAALATGEAIVFIFGCAWLAAFVHLGWSRALTAGALPFLPGEALKLALVVVVVRTTQRFRGTRAAS
jgi:biotin transport system substrate-specific component